MVDCAREYERKFYLNGVKGLFGGAIIHGEI